MSDLLPASDFMPHYNDWGKSTERHFFFCVGQARSGTTWMAQFMTSEYTYCYHELSIRCHGEGIGTHTQQRGIYPKPYYGTLEKQQMARLLYLYPSYWRRLLHRAYSGPYWAVGNSDASNCAIALALHRVWPTARFAFMIRNGPRQALSVVHSSSQGRTFRDAFGRWARNSKRLIAHAELIGENAKVVYMDALWSCPDLLEPLWEFLTAESVPFPTEKKRMSSKIVNKGGGPREMLPEERLVYEEILRENRELLGYATL